MTIGAILLPANWQSEINYWEVDPRNSFPPPPVVLPNTQDEELTTPHTMEASEHTKGARPSTKGKHEKGQARKNLDKGGEKGEKNPPRRRPPDWKGPWPPKSSN